MSRCQQSQVVAPHAVFQKIVTIGLVATSKATLHPVTEECTKRNIVPRQISTEMATMGPAPHAPTPQIDNCRKDLLEFCGGHAADNVHPKAYSFAPAALGGPGTLLGRAEWRDQFGINACSAGALMVS